MKVKLTKEKDGKIKITPERLKELLDEAYWEGYRYAESKTWTYTSPNYWWSPYTYTITSNGTGITYCNSGNSSSANTISSGSATIKTSEYNSNAGTVTL